MTRARLVIGRGVRRSAAVALGLVTVLGVSGCGGPAKRAVSGSVTLDGKPLDEAVIMFVPLDVQAAKTGAAITAGRYDVARDVGLFPGRYRVEIADDPPLDGAHQAPARKAPPRRPFLMVYASVASPLSVEITPDGETVFDFALSSKPSKAP